jgi:hypothetical protein
MALAPRRIDLHRCAMANKNVFAVIAIGIFLIGVVGTILMLLYTAVVAIFKSAFGIDLPHLH